MKKAAGFAVVLVTAPDLKTARMLAGTVLRERLAACVNLVPRIESHYWWNGKLEKGAEVMMIIKTTRPRLKKLAEIVAEKHPYDTPEFLVLPVDAGAGKYLSWLAASVKPV